MSVYLVGAALVIFSYLLGSVAFGLIITRMVKGIDIRQYASGSTGATNVMRACGWRWGILAFALDMFKAALPLLIVIYIYDFGIPSWVHPVIGLAAIFGHIWPIFTNFRGGKGIASGWSALIVLSPWSGLIAGIFSFPFMLFTRYVSLGSIIGSLSGGIAITTLSIFGYIEPSYCAFGLVGSALTILKHKDNINRLLNGTERKIGATSD
jgi:glycerol-3-phosphate acyltransferase PlsY